MKRILAITLTLVMVLAALTGCMASKNPSGDEGGTKSLRQTLAHYFDNRRNTSKLCRI